MHKNTYRVHTVHGDAGEAVNGPQPQSAHATVVVARGHHPQHLGRPPRRACKRIARPDCLTAKLTQTPSGSIVKILRNRFLTEEVSEETGGRNEVFAVEGCIGCGSQAGAARRSLLSLSNLGRLSCSSADNYCTCIGGHSVRLRPAPAGGQAGAAGREARRRHHQRAAEMRRRRRVRARAAAAVTAQRRCQTHLRPGRTVSVADQWRYSAGSLVDSKANPAPLATDLSASPCPLCDVSMCKCSDTSDMSTNFYIPVRTSTHRRRAPSAPVVSSAGCAAPPSSSSPAPPHSRSICRPGTSCD